MKKIANLVESRMHSLMSDPAFGFHKSASMESCCAQCGKDCKCDAECKCQGKCDKACVKCASVEKTSYQEIFGIIINSSEKLDNLGFEKAAAILLKASEDLMEEVAEESEKEEEEESELHEVESDPELSSLLEKIRERRADELGSDCVE